MAPLLEEEYSRAGSTDRQGYPDLKKESEAVLAAKNASALFNYQ